MRSLLGHCPPSYPCVLYWTMVPLIALSRLHCLLTLYLTPCYILNALPLARSNGILIRSPTEWARKQRWFCSCVFIFVFIAMLDLPWCGKVIPLFPGECVRCMFWNNLGCIHFAMGKHNLGIFYFKKALQENDHTCAQIGNGGNGQSKCRHLLDESGACHGYNDLLNEVGCLLLCIMNDVCASCVYKDWCLIWRI